MALVPLKPTTYKQVLSSLEAAQWKTAIADELNLHAANKTWVLIELPKNWLWHLFHDLYQAASLHEATLIQCDNQLALALVDTTKFHSQTKHIVVRYHFIPQLTTQQKIRFQYCLTSEMRVYIFTKFLTGLKLTPHLR